MNSRLRNRLHTKVRDFVEPGETVQAAFSVSTRPIWTRMVTVAAAVVLATSMPNFFPDQPMVGIPAGAALAGGVAGLYFLVTPNRVIVVTDQRVLVLACRAMTALTPTQVLRGLPRSTTLGTANPIKGLGEPLWVQVGFKDEVRSANVALQA